MIQITANVCQKAISIKQVRSDVFPMTPTARSGTMFGIYFRQDRFGVLVDADVDVAVSR
jgi:hypothetical protein